MKSMLPAFIQKMLKGNAKHYHVGIAIYKDVVRFLFMELKEDTHSIVEHFDRSYQNDDQLPGLFESVINDFKLDGSRVSIVLPTGRVQSTQIELTDIPPQNPQEALPWKLKELINIPPQDMVCDYIDMTLQPFGQSPKAQIIATSRSYLERIVEPFHEGDVEICDIVTEQFAVAKLQTSKDAAQLVLLQHAKSDALILILKNQQICFARKIRGSESLTQMGPEQIKMGGTDNVAIEIQRSIDYYESQLKQPPIKNVFIAIEGEQVPMIIEAFDASLPVKSKAFTFEDIALDFELTLDFIPALGAAMSTIEQVPTAESVE